MRSRAEPLVPSFKLDYFGPEATADPGDGDDGDGRGRGKLFAFSEEADHGLGAANVAAGMILVPGGTCGLDLGAGAPLRQWGATAPAHRSQLDQIIDPANTAPHQGEYDEVLLTHQQKSGKPPWDPGTPEELADSVAEEGGLPNHEHDSVEMNLGQLVTSATMQGKRCAGFADISPGCEQFELAQLSCDWTATSASACPLFTLRDAKLEIDRHVKQSRVAIIQTSRDAQRGDGAGATSGGPGGGAAGPSGGMGMPGDQNIPFDEYAQASRGGGGGSSDPAGIQWDHDYDVNTATMPPEHTYKSSTGNASLGEGGLSGLSFDKLSATLKFYPDGEQYFEATPRVRWANFESNGVILMGRLDDISPLQQHDPNVVEFLGNITEFNGAYQKTSLQAKISSYSCTFDIGGGIAVAGWNTCTQNQFAVGGKVRGWITGEALCFVSVRGDMTLIGGRINNVFKTQGNFWLGGGIGFCDPDSWDRRHQVLEDDFCLACVLDTQLSGTFPPATLDLQMDGPDVECNGPF